MKIYGPNKQVIRRTLGFTGGEMVEDPGEYGGQSGTVIFGHYEQPIRNEDDPPRADR